MRIFISNAFSLNRTRYHTDLVQHFRSIFQN